MYEASTTNTSTSTDKKLHLVVMQHGLHGSRKDFDIVKYELEKKIKEFSYGEEYMLLSSATNDYFLATHDGIDKCGERLSKEIQELDSKYHFCDMSIIGHSLGGLIIRYAIGDLYQAGFFSHCNPNQFITLSSPHVGSRRPSSTLFNKIANVFTSNCISKTGKQLAFDDDLEAPLLVRMSKGNFLEGLALFRSRTLYSNILNDIQVTFCTSDISHSNPYTKMNQTEWKFHSDYQHVIHESIYSKLSEDIICITKDDPKKASFIRECITNLQSLEFNRYHLFFTTPLSHTHVIVKRPSVNNEGYDVLLHLISKFNFHNNYNKIPDNN